MYGNVFLPISEMAMPGKRKHMNLEIIRSNLSEALEELHGLEQKAASGELNEGDFQVRLLHAYHHLNFAWNIRYATTAQYATLTDEKFV
jgi:hypothetical protein